VAVNPIVEDTASGGNPLIVAAPGARMYRAADWMRGPTPARPPGQPMLDGGDRDALPAPGRANAACLNDCAKRVPRCRLSAAGEV
jgi:hypothetical protein